MWLPRDVPAYSDEGFLIGPVSSRSDQRPLIGSICSVRHGAVTSYLPARQ